MPLSRITSPFQSSTANVYSPSANTVAIRTASADRVTVDSSGRVGVNYTALSNNDVSIIKGLFELGNAGNMVYGTGGVQTGMITNLYYNGGWKVAQTGSAAAMYYQLDGQHTFAGSDYATSAGSAGAANPATTLLRITKDKSLSLQGASQQTGIGITFPASQSASSDPNTLDDYEEGTWTPVITTSGASLTYSNQAGYYVKIAKFVYFGFQININTLSSNGSGTFNIGGLPYTMSATNYGRYFVQTNSVNFDGTAHSMALYPDGSVGLNLLYAYDNGGWTVGTAANFVMAGGSIITCVGGYFAAS
jgi:hypothetical protein